jgi:hypothetical protein
MGVGANVRYAWGKLRPRERRTLKALARIIQALPTKGASAYV